MRVNKREMIWKPIGPATETSVLFVIQPRLIGFVLIPSPFIQDLHWLYRLHFGNLSKHIYGEARCTFWRIVPLKVG